MEQVGRMSESVPVTVLCRIRPKTPDEFGYSTMETLKEAMERQQVKPRFSQRLRPCPNKRGYWQYLTSCLKCSNAILTVRTPEGTTAKAKVEESKKNSLRLILIETGEVIETNYT